MAFKSVRERRQRHPAVTILKYLALNGKISQPELSSLVHTRSLIRVLQGLEALHLVRREKHRTKKSSIGAPHNLCSLTFDGVGSVLRWKLEAEEVDVIIMKHRDVSPIFEKWAYISQGEYRKTAMSLLLSYGGIPYIGEDELDSILVKRATLPFYERFMIVSGVESVHEEDFLSHMLAIDSVMSGLCLLADRPPICDYFDHLIRDKDLRGIVNRFFRLEEGRYGVVQRMRELYNL